MKSKIFRGNIHHELRCKGYLTLDVKIANYYVERYKIVEIQQFLDNKYPWFLKRKI